MPELILKLTGDDFENGLSLQKYKAVGGLWQQLSNYDPFQKLGQLYPTLGPTRKDGGSIAVNINSFTLWTDGATPFLFAIGNRNSSDKSAYKINLSDDTITDISSAIHQQLLTTQTANAKLITTYQNKLIYHSADSLRYNDPASPTAGEDGYTISSNFTDGVPHPACLGSNGYLYVGNGRYIAQVTDADNSGSNDARKFDSLQDDLYCKDVDQDGYFLVAGFDNNSNSISGIVADCQVMFWDKYKSYPDKRYPIKEAYIIGVRCLGQTTLVWTPGGIYECSIATAPYLKYPLTSEAPFYVLPTDFNQITKDGHSVYWGDKAGTAQVYALGQKITGRPRIIYNPYEATATTENQLALIVSGSYIYSSTDIARIYKLNSATGKSVTAKPCPKYLNQPYSFSFTKIKLKSAMASGDQVSHALYNSDDEIISGSESINYSNQPGLKTLIFRRTASGGATITDFTDIVPYITTNVEIAEVEVYGEPTLVHSVQK